MRNIKACLSHKSDEWKTPTKLYNAFMEMNYIDCFKYQSKEDEFKKEYYNQKLFVNPPFSKMDKVVDWIILNSRTNYIALLIPARTDTKYFHKLLKLYPTIYFIEGRLHYNDSKSAPFPTILMVFLKENNFFPIYKQVTQEQLIGKIKNENNKNN